MIVSAPYRSGGTSLCTILAKEHNLHFEGQIDNNAVPFTRMEDKNFIHEHQNQPDHTINSITKLLIDDSGSIVLNNSNPALFVRSDYFIVRQDFSQVYASMYWMMAKLYPTMGKHPVEMMFKRITFYNALFLDYLKETGTKPLILEEQSWYVPKDNQVIPKEIQDMIPTYTTYLEAYK